ncbi:MAG: hypothetical protein MUF54_03835 [Polyangiaceae bacterium]|jgi:hypothetical protein|nr:hypothetical protein [Polyangiaceae bacterium]
MSKSTAQKGTKKPGESFDAKLLEANAQSALPALLDAGDKAVELIDAWTKAGNVEAVVAIAHDETAPSPARKQARRGLAVFKSRGIALPEPTAPAASKPAAAEPEFEAWFLATDQSGIAVYAIGARTTGARYEIVDVRLHEGAGVIELHAGEATRSGIRGNFKDLEARFGYAPVPVPVDWARWRIDQARARNKISGLILPLGFETSTRLLQPVPEQEPMHPIDAAELTLDDSQTEQRAASSASLHNEPEFRGWLPEIQFVNDLLQRVGGRLGPEESNNQDRVNAIFADEISAAVDRFFTPDVRQRLALRMKDSAISVLARAGKERTLDVLATAEAAKRAGLVTSPPSDVPFLKAFFEKALALVAASQDGKLSIPISAKPREERKSLVVPPEVLEEAAKTRAGRGDEPSEGEPQADL